MKVWVTRPRSDEVYLGGWRRVKLWVEKPHFDHRPAREEFELKDPETEKYFGCVFKEHGWYSRADSTRAKGFFKQDPEMMKRVWLKIYESCVPADCPDPQNKEMNDKEYRRLYSEPHYEMICCTHWKRFLLEIDLYQKTVTLIEPKSVIDINGPIGTYPMTRELSASYFVDEDMSRPFFFDDPQFKHFKHCDKRQTL
jgi:hypothetical protein